MKIQLKEIMKKKSENCISYISEHCATFGIKISIWPVFRSAASLPLEKAPPPPLYDWNQTNSVQFQTKPNQIKISDHIYMYIYSVQVFMREKPVLFVGPSITYMATSLPQKWPYLHEKCAQC